MISDQIDIGNVALEYISRNVLIANQYCSDWWLCPRFEHAAESRMAAESFIQVENISGRMDQLCLARTNEDAA
jgi:hypothetical protein